MFDKEKVCEKIVARALYELKADIVPQHIEKFLYSVIHGIGEYLSILNKDVTHHEYEFVIYGKKNNKKPLISIHSNSFSNCYFRLAPNDISTSGAFLTFDNEWTGTMIAINMLFHHTYGGIIVDDNMFIHIFRIAVEEIYGELLKENNPLKDDQFEITFANIEDIKTEYDFYNLIKCEE